MSRDGCTYRKKVVRTLKNLDASKELIKAIKAANDDVRVAKILIESKNFEILISVYGLIDARRYIMMYINSLDSGIIYEFHNIDKNLDFSSNDDEFSRLIELLDNESNEMKKKLRYNHETVAKEIYEEYFGACQDMRNQYALDILALEEEMREMKKLM